MKNNLGVITLCALGLAGCGASSPPSESEKAANNPPPAVCDTADDLPFPSPDWSAREAANFAKITEAPSRQA